MGYEVSIHEKWEDVDARFKRPRQYYDFNNKEKYKNVLKSMILVSFNNEKLEDVYDSIKSYVVQICLEVDKEWRESMEERSKEDDIFFCGWDMQKDYIETDYTEIVKNVTEKLYLIATTSKRVLMYDSQDDEYNDLYYKKLNDIESEINYLEEALWDFLSHDFVIQYRKKEDESY